MPRINKVQSNYAGEYLVIGARRIIERMFGREAQAKEIGFEVVQENTEEKTITVKLHRTICTPSQKKRGRS